MNNNQNNNGIGMPNLTPTPMNNQTISSGMTIPGANLTPIGPNEVVGQVNQTMPAGNGANGMVPGIITGDVPANNLPPISNSNAMPVNNASVVPSIVNQDLSNNGGIPNNQVNNMPNMNNGQLISPAIPINSISNNNGISQPNNSTVINNSFGDATPLTGESANDGVDLVSVGTYLKYLLFIFILPISFIIYLVKAFSKKENKNINNFAKALLLFTIIIIVLIIAFFVILRMINF